MRITRRAIALLGAAGSALAIVACVDLFHSTTFDTLCTVDPGADACPPIDAGDGAPAADAARDAGPTAFCSFTQAQAHDHAVHACAWLGACESPLGNNAFGTCMIQATLAYDCAVNPNRPVLGAMHDYWDCLWKVDSCAAVEKCVRPLGPLGCSGNNVDYTQCENAGGDAGDPNTRISCRASSSTTEMPAAGVENCVGAGRTCARFPQGDCNGSATNTCLVNGCEGTHLHACDDAGVRDLGVDCRYFGAGRCVTNAAGAACLALDSGACDPSAPIACDGGVAVGCPSGVHEAINCGALLGTTSACNVTAATSTWEVASACEGSSTCTADTCTANNVTSCARGATFSGSCAQVGLGACHLVTLPADAGTFAACKAP